MKKILYFVFLLLIPLKNIAQVKINYITIEKNNKLDNINSLETLKNCIIDCNRFPKDAIENKNIEDSMNSLNLQLELHLIKFNGFQDLKIHEKFLENTIILKMPYKINESFFAKLYTGFKKEEKRNNDGSYFYFIDLSPSTTCTKDEKPERFRSALLSCLKIISISKNSVEYLSYQNNNLQKKLDILETKFNAKNIENAQIIDSLRIIKSGPIKNEAKFELNTDFQTVIWAQDITKNNIGINFNKINQVNFSANYKFREHIFLGLGLGYTENYFKTSIAYDSISIPIQIINQNMLEKAIISHSILESNSYRTTIFSIFGGYKFHLLKSNKLDLIIEGRLFISPKFKITSVVNTSNIDYVGYSYPINEPIVNIDELGLRSGVQFNHLERSHNYQQFGFMLSPKFIYNCSKFNASIGLNYSFQAMKNNGTIQKYISSNYNEYNSSASRLNKFSFSSLLLNFSIGIKI